MKRLYLWAWVIASYAGAFLTLAPLWTSDYHPNRAIRRLMELDHGA